MSAERREEITRGTFLKTTLAAIPAALLLFVAGCGAEEEDEDD